MSFALRVQGDPPERSPVVVSGRKPRAYQRDALDAYWKVRDQHRGVALELFTGAGKTYLTGEIARKLMNEGKRTLFVCNRRVLGYQSLDELASGTGVRWELEQAENRASRTGKAPVVALVQTMQGDRLKSWDPDAFDQIVGDEIHRLMGKEYRKVFEYFSTARILGLSATLDGAKGYGGLITHTAYSMDMVEAIDQAWSVPFCFEYYGANVDLDSIEWKKTKDGGDFDPGELDKAIAGIGGQIRAAAFDLCGDLKTLVRCPGIQSVIAATEAMNDPEKGRPGCARMIYGEMDDHEKVRNIRDHKAGLFQFLVSCMMIGEGYDDPTVQCLLNARPTTKRHDAAQWWGRAGRLWRGIGEIEDESERRLAIERSPKPKALIFELNAKCRHDLACPTTVYGKDFDDATKRLAKKKIEREGGDPLEILKRSAAEIERRRARAAAAAAAKVKLEREDPREPPPRINSAGEHALTIKQERKLTEFGIPFDREMTKVKANKLIRSEFLCRAKGLCNYRQREFLARWVGVKRPWGVSEESGKRLVARWKEVGKRVLSSVEIASAMSGGVQ